MQVAKYANAIKIDLLIMSQPIRIKLLCSDLESTRCLCIYATGNFKTAKLVTDERASHVSSGRKPYARIMQTDI